MTFRWPATVRTESGGIIELKTTIQTIFGHRCSLFFWFLKYRSLQLMYYVRMDNQHGHFGGMQHSFSHTAHDPALPPAVAMCCHGDEIAAFGRARAFRVLTYLGHIDNAGGYIAIRHRRPG